MSTPVSPAALMPDVRRVVAEAARFLRAHLGRVSEGDIERKDLNSLVSYVDQTAEAQLVEGLAPLLPTAGFLTEEGTVIQLETEYRWVIDPLDGTTNFLHQLPCFSVSVALERHRQPILGVVHEVVGDECFYATRGGGTFLNGEPVRVSDRPRLADSLLATGFPYTDFTQFDEYLEVFTHFARHSRGLRRFGSAAIDLAYTAAGRFDAFFEQGINRWDIAAGVLLVEEAGGQVMDYHGGSRHLDGAQVLAGNAAVVAEMRPVLARAYPKIGGKGGSA